MPGEHVGPTPAQTLRARDLRPRKRLGQNFLQDRSFLARIVAAAEASEDDEVLEVGPGTGVLTAELARVCRRVVAVELDDALFTLLTGTIGNEPNVELIHADALAIDPCAHFAGPYKLVANIPYYITGQLIRSFLESECQPGVLVLMLQREVAERMAASTGRLSLLGVSVQYYAQVRVMGRVPAGAFFPRPKVDSAIVRLTPYRRRDSAEADAFFHVVRAGFSMPRKQLANTLSAGLSLSRDETNALLASAGVDGRLRPERLSVSDWERLAHVGADNHRL